MATARRVISASPRVISAASELFPKPKPLADSGADRDDIFQRGANLDAGWIVVGVQAEGGA